MAQGRARSRIDEATAPAGRPSEDRGDARRDGPAPRRSGSRRPRSARCPKPGPSPPSGRTRAQRPGASACSGGRRAGPSSRPPALRARPRHPSAGQAPQPPAPSRVRFGALRAGARRLARGRAPPRGPARSSRRRETARRPRAGALRSRRQNAVPPRAPVRGRELSRGGADWAGRRSRAARTADRNRPASNGQPTRRRDRSHVGGDPCASARRRAPPERSCRASERTRRRARGSAPGRVESPFVSRVASASLAEPTVRGALRSVSALPSKKARTGADIGKDSRYASVLTERKLESLDRLTDKRPDVAVGVGPVPAANAFLACASRLPADRPVMAPRATQSP